MQDPKFIYSQAKSSMLSGDFAQAAKCFLALIQMMPDESGFHYNLASCLFELKDFIAAEKYYRSSLVLEQDPVAYFNLGVVCEKLNKPGDAREAYEKAIAQNPNYYEAHFNIALLAIENDSLKLAEKHLNVCLSLQPNNEVAEFQLARVMGQTPVKPPKQHIENLFDAYADHFDDHLTGDLEYRVPQIMIDSAVKQNLNLSGAVLDLGCGTGLLGQALCQNYSPSQLVGIDLSQKMLEVATQKNIYHTLVQSDLLTYMNQNDQQFHVIFAADVLNYLGDLSQVFQSVKNKLNLGGCFMFTLETHGQLNQDYQLAVEGRYKHHSKYIENILHGLGGSYHAEPIVGRTQNGAPVQMELYVVLN